MQRQRGMALLVVLLLLAVMVTMASSMTQRFRMEWQRTYSLQVQQQNYWYLLGSETLIAKILTQDFNDSPEKIRWHNIGQQKVRFFRLKTPCYRA